jgi:prevent-host-death family protein
MKTLSLSEAKMKLSGLIDQVEATDEEVVITRNGRPAAVLVSSDEYDSWKETRSVAADADLMGEIRQGIEDLKTGNAKLYSLADLFEE